jgi:hypothetical protein
MDGVALLFITMLMYFWNLEFTLYDKRLPPIVKERCFDIRLTQQNFPGKPVLGFDRSWAWTLLARASLTLFTLLESGLRRCASSSP